MSDVPVISIARSDARRPLVFSWGVSSYFGWGIYGLNLMLHLAEHPDVAPVCAIAFGPGDVVLDPLRNRRMAAMADNSAPLWTALSEARSERVELEHMLLEGLGNDLTSAVSAHGKVLSGRPSIGVVFLEQATLSPEGRQRADRFALIVAGSSWNEQVLRRQGIRAVTTVLQGVDAALYHPAPRSGLFPGRFVVFSGGKLEFRKGQDLVLAAFRAFRQRHAEALLVTAWHSPWSELAEIAVGHKGITPPPRSADGTPDMAGWAVANGIPEDAIVSVGHTPNIAMPYVVREADVAVFANRCEGGTNLVAMECMACGIPTILSANTGHLDLLRHAIALPLERQGVPVSAHYDTTDWGESDVEEMLEKLETVWRDRTAAAALGRRAARFMAGMTWRDQLFLLLRAIDPFVED
ncbi:MAG TPA: glycosyltransferase [Acetobacteraceae bacterium]|nr:glycosyltransferase [Acetobacteraceae bacterium]